MKALNVSQPTLIACAMDAPYTEVRALICTHVNQGILKAYWHRGRRFISAEDLGNDITTAWCFNSSLSSLLFAPVPELRAECRRIYNHMLKKGCIHCNTAFPFIAFDNIRYDYSNMRKKE